MAKDKTARYDGEEEDDDEAVEELDDTALAPTQDEIIHAMDMSLIYAEDQDRTSFDVEKLGELAQGMKTMSQVQPIIVRHRPSEQGQYAIVVGERRWRAAKMLRWPRIHAIIRDLDDLQTARLQWAENRSRVDLNPVEEALAIEKRIIAEGWIRTSGKLQGKYNEGKAARKLAMKESTLHDRLQLLHLTKEIRDLIASGMLGTSYAISMVGLNPMYQWKAFTDLRDMHRPTARQFFRHCKELLAQQMQQPLLTEEDLLRAPTPPSDTPATPDRSARRYAPHPSLPPLPKGKTVGAVLDRYIEALKASGDPVQVDAARVLGHVYDELRAANKIRD